MKKKFTQFRWLLTTLMLVAAMLMSSVCKCTDNKNTKQGIGEKSEKKWNQLLLIPLMMRWMPSRKRLLRVARLMRIKPSPAESPYMVPQLT